MLSTIHNFACLREVQDRHEGGEGCNGCKSIESGHAKLLQRQLRSKDLAMIATELANRLKNTIAFFCDDVAQEPEEKLKKWKYQTKGVSDFNHYKFHSSENENYLRGAPEIDPDIQPTYFVIHPPQQVAKSNSKKLMPKAPD